MHGGIVRASRDLKFRDCSGSALQSPRSMVRSRNAFGVTAALNPAMALTHATILIWEEDMATLVGFGTFAALPEEEISEKISRRILSGDKACLSGGASGPASMLSRTSRTSCARRRSPG